jgi:hypothetical protein
MNMRFVISSGSENHDPAEGGSLLSEAKSRRRVLLRDLPTVSATRLASPSYGSRGVYPEALSLILSLSKEGSKGSK